MLWCMRSTWQDFVSDAYDEERRDMRMAKAIYKNLILQCSSKDLQLLFEWRKVDDYSWL